MMREIERFGVEMEEERKNNDVKCESGVESGTFRLGYRN
jgi:hypothetical protein